jgi:branched-chain amino acid aminotransferase
MAAGNSSAFFKGRIVPIEEAKVSIMTSALNYGTAIFEGIRAYWNPEEEQLYILKLREHYERFLQNCRIILIDLPYSVDDLCETTLELLRKEAFHTDVYIRPLAYKSSETVGVRLHDLDCDCSIFAIPFGEYIDTPKGARLMVSSWRRIPDNCIPPRGKVSGAYVNSSLAKTEAHDNGFDDALMLACDGQVSEASAAHIFIVRNGVLVTPPVSAGILEGITRMAVMELARDLGFEVLERPIDRSELYIADDAFLVGTGVGVVPVVEFDHRTIGDGTVGETAKAIRDLYLRAVRGQEKKYKDWCAEVYLK